MNHNNQQPGSAVECRACEGSGYIETGIEESPTTQCRKCEGTGFAPAVEQSAEKVASIDHDAFWVLVAHCRDAKPGEDYRKASAALVNYVDQFAATRRTTGGDGFALHFSREDWGVIFDGVMLEIERSEKRKQANSESNSDERADAGRAILKAIRLAAPVSAEQAPAIEIANRLYEAGYADSSQGKVCNLSNSKVWQEVSAGQAVQCYPDGGMFCTAPKCCEESAAPVSPPDGAMPEQWEVKLARDYPNSTLEEIPVAVRFCRAKAECEAWRAAQPAEGSALVARPEGDSFKPVFWFSILVKCARLLNLPDDEPSPSGVLRAVEKMVAAPERSDTPAPFRRVGWFVYEGGCWVATSSDDPRATTLFRTNEDKQGAQGDGT